MPMGDACALSMLWLIVIETLKKLDVTVVYIVDDILKIQPKIESSSDHLIKVE